MLETIAKVIYGTVLLAMILQTPKVYIVITFNPSRSQKFYAEIDGFLTSLLLAGLFTLMAVLPIRELNGLIRPGKRMFVMLVFPWVSTCCLMFISNSVLLLRIAERTFIQGTWNCFARALMAYCALFGFAVELMMHWYSIYQFHNWPPTIHETYPVL